MVIRYKINKEEKFMMFYGPKNSKVGLKEGSVLSPLSRHKNKHRQSNITIISMKERTHRISMHGQVLEQFSSYNYLGKIKEDCGKIYKDIKEKIGKARRLHKSSRNAFLGKNLPKEIKTHVYQKAVEPSIVYGSEYWTTVTYKESKILPTEMRFLRKNQEIISGNFHKCPSTPFCWIKLTSNTNEHHARYLYNFTIKIYVKWTQKLRSIAF